MAEETPETKPPEDADVERSRRIRGILWAGATAVLISMMWLPKMAPTCAGSDSPEVTAGAPEAKGQGAELAGPVAEPMPEAALPDFEQSRSLEAEGKIDAALQAAEAAVVKGGGRDAALQASKLAILKGDLERAGALLEPLAETDPEDAPVRFNLALVAQKKGRYNDARSGYLAALRGDPDYADARYNLAILTFGRGVVEEAQHHARKFREMRPGTEQARKLAEVVGLKE